MKTLLSPQTAAQQFIQDKTKYCKKKEKNKNTQILHSQLI